MSDTGVATRDDFLALSLPRELVPIPELGKPVWIRAQNSRERDLVESLALSGKVDIDIQSQLVLRVCQTEDGANLFRPEDLESLSTIVPYGAVDRIVRASERLSRVTAEESAALKKKSKTRTGETSGESQ